MGAIWISGEKLDCPKIGTRTAGQAFEREKLANWEPYAK